MITWVHDSDSDQLVFRSEDGKIVHCVESKIGLVTSTKLPVKEVFQSLETRQVWIDSIKGTPGVLISGASISVASISKEP